jgi:uncharacterized protein YjbJ (UPF0337 family)
MNTEQLKGKWKQFHGAAKARWGKLTDDDWTTAEGDAEVLAGKIQEKYGDTREAAHAEIDKVFQSINN